MRSKMDFMTRSNRQLSWRTIGEVAIDSDYNTERIGKILFPEFSKYIRQDEEIKKLQMYLLWNK